MIQTPKAWAVSGTVQMPVIPAHAELTPDQARSFARSLEQAANRAEAHIQTLARLTSKVIRLDEDWQTAYGDAIEAGHDRF